MTYCMILTTCPDKKEAKKLAADLVDNRLAACVQLSDVVSFYTWEGDACIDNEIRLVIKTRKQLYSAVQTYIKAHHSYDVPQIVQVPIENGLDDYLDWINQNTGL